MPTSTTHMLTQDEADAARQAAVITSQLEELLATTTPLLAELRQLLERVAPDSRLRGVD